MIPILCNESLGVKRSLNKTPIEDVDSILQFTFNDNGTARHVIKLLLFHSNTKKMHKEEAIWQQKRPWLNTALVRDTKESLLKDPKSHCFDKKGQTNYQQFDKEILSIYCMHYSTVKPLDYNSQHNSMLFR